jgi:hypothetical protein
MHDSKVIAIEAKTRWYDPELESPVNEIPSAKKDKMIAPTLRHARMFGYLPSITTITKLKANWSLDNWIQDNIITTCASNKFTGNPENPTEIAEYIRAIKKLSSEYASNAADIGSFIHKEVELSIAHRQPPTLPAAVRVADRLRSWMEENGLHDATCEKSLCSKQLGYAGTPDLFAFDANNNPHVIDLKTVEIEKFKEPHDSWKLQLGGCMGLLRENFTDLGTNPGLWQCVADRESGETIIIHHSDEMGWSKAFINLAEVYFISTGYDPREYWRGRL